MWDPKLLRLECYNIYYYYYLFLHITIVLYNLFYNAGSRSIEIGMLQFLLIIIIIFTYYNCIV
jgi:hypothetical protein